MGFNNTGGEVVANVISLSLSTLRRAQDSRVPGATPNSVWGCFHYDNGKLSLLIGIRPRSISAQAAALDQGHASGSSANPRFTGLL